MHVVDIVILAILIFFVVLGFIRGFTRELVSLVGIFVILILSFILKNPVSVFLYNNLPFFKFGGIFKDMTVLNILLYEVIAFLIVFAVLTAIFKFIIIATKLFEKVLTMTIILGIPSKILGAVLGLIQGIIYTFIILYILNLPTFNFKPVRDSKIGNIILDKTPILNKVCDDTIYVFNEIIKLKDEYMTTNDVKQFNQDAIDMMIERNIITEDNAQKLLDKGKIKDVVIKKKNKKNV